MSSSPRLPVPWLRSLAGALLIVASTAGLAAPPEPPAAQTLRATHQRMSDKLDHSSFGRPVQIDSMETADGLQGDVYAVVDHPLSEISSTLKGSAHWCDVLTLHINNRRCTVAGGAQGRDTLTLYVVRRYDKPIDQAFELPFVYRVVGASPEHLSVELSAESGPLGTSNYRVRLEALALDEQKSFLHFSYSYDHNAMVRLGTTAYLATFGSDKVGFTVLGKTPEGQPDYIRGLRGLVERNAMRYFLTLDAYLAAPGADQADRRQRRWFAAAEQYPRQLHEVDLDTYLALKREDRQRDGVATR
ncbi:MULTISPECIES: hypothetical protein [Variovorax]|jgi:hypothetical protein|uniref:hypothetical protein n=1 Tax=Variovorax TaxID=34072 RepID=UPI00086FA3AE|nr:MULTISPECIES: hypothetical protein [Variovorax]MBN8758598.1 hypothetical protein [Variovorax sp.]ODU11637.1 MAG: hypothetical protein ABS94_33300 [Variovorax sp. SCN 67-85]ODV14998.1 MAG: hypothetical protein ABT25_34645 [Variovorax sp. SCN 67-20]OJZ05281.1 MAG: hypothetical protein BGP22_10970 [Variovorax sp. 67-131]UKI05280.1 hypothetical protein L3V85_20855 [Variovorax paradoxus]